MIQEILSECDPIIDSPGVPAAPVLFSPVVAKLSRPRVPVAFVPRERLVHMLDVGSRRPVTLVSAGAGWGKTLLVASWAETAAPPGPVGWLSLDAEDNSPGAFWSNLVAALRATGAVPEGSELAEIGGGLAVDRTLIERITRALARLPGPVVLVLDDLHAVDDPDVLRDLGVFLRYQPDQVRLVLLTRADPGLPLYRLRAADLLSEIRAADLEFTLDEAAELLAHHDVHLPEDDLRILLDRTEGWAAGLRLAAAYLTARGSRHGIANFAGDKGAVADYLIGEVLARLAPEVRRFLMDTSIVDQLSGDLADAITGGTHGQAMLEQLERTNAFVVGFGAKPDWFRYHHLLSDLLRHLLRVEAPEIVPDLHLRAAAWYAGHNASVKAVKHATAAEDWSLVGRLVVAGLAPLILSSHRDALVKALTRVPAERLAATAELTVCLALLMFHARDYEGIQRRIADARRLMADRAPADRRPVEIALKSLEVALARVRGDMPALINAATEILHLLLEVPLGELPATMQYRAIAVNNKGVGLLWTGDLDRADQFLWSAVMGARAAGIELVEINATGHLGLVEYLRGALRKAHDHATSGRDLAERRGWSATLQVVPSYVALAMIEYERNDMVAAELALERGFDAHRADPEAGQLVALRIVQTRLLLARGRLDAARRILTKTWREANVSMIAPILVRWLRLVEAEIDLAAGQPLRVRSRLGGRPDNEALAQREQVALARADLALGNAEQADSRLAPVRDAATDVVAAVEAWVVTALIADHQRRNGRSVDGLVRAIEIAEPEGIRRPFLSIDKRRTSTLFDRHRWLAHEKSDFVLDLQAELTPGGSPSQPGQHGAELSARELEVLRYLPTVFNAGEIADELHVSVNTVKAHLRSIYRKLDVSRRRDAVVRARDLGLLW
jgi:LuxR family maltose regulon positive regulatory protein